MNTKPQLPIEGKLNKDFSITGPFGYRMHPIRHERIHHNGVDLWSAKEPCKIEVWFDGIVIAKGYSSTGFGNYVILRHKVYGKDVTSLYAHMKAESGLRKGQRVKAGDIVGIMGATGGVTGKHLHFELEKGRTHPNVFGGDGKTYYEPIAFVQATIKKWEAEHELEKAHKQAVLPTPINSLTVEMPDHSIAVCDGMPSPKKK
jgi:murein DD-endopeptidase MepM/ murein hydrolase activator NlpD